MRGNRWGIVVVLAAGAAATPAYAQLDTNYGNMNTVQAGRNNALATSAGVMMMPPDRDTPGSLKTYNQMLDYGRCAATSSVGGKMSLAMAEMPNSPTETRLWEQFTAARASCQGQMGSNIRTLARGAYAEGLYKARLVKGVPYGGFQPADPGYQKFLAAEEAHNRNLDKQDRVMAGATNCMVAQQPGLVDALLASKHGSADEARLMDALFTVAPSCAGAKRPDRLSRSFLRAFLADSAYRYAAFRAPKLISPQP